MKSSYFAVLACALSAISLGAAEAQTCASVRYYYTTLASDVPLACSSDGEAILEVEVPSGVTGRAVGRFTMPVENTSTSAIYFWNAFVTVGDPIHSYGIGDDVCPGATAPARQSLGYGQLTSTSNKVIAKAYQGSAPCVDGKLKAKAGATLVVWVEDPSPSCVGNTIKYSSFYGRNKPEEGLSWWHWPHIMTTVAKEKMTLNALDSGLIVVTAAEGTPWVNPNTSCGSESATLAAQIVVDGSIKATQVTPVPASSGMGHLVFGMYHPEYLGQGEHTVELMLGRNFGGTDDLSRTPSQIVTSGGCCGDAAMAVIKF
ncbi:MAG TPA: hypothetical protein VGO52_18500 [Hyphomonadaceae bacterium]|jgi:hypothetical protein|nr:hypothetical protein [Hyphomonadaceae bacterium]